jgi:hypothetical protein
MKCLDWFWLDHVPTTEGRRITQDGIESEVGKGRLPQQQRNKTNVPQDFSIFRCWLVLAERAYVALTHLDFSCLQVTKNGKKLLVQKSGWLWVRLRHPQFSSSCPSSGDCKLWVLSLLEQITLEVPNLTFPHLTRCEPGDRDALLVFSLQVLASYCYHSHSLK